MKTALRGALPILALLAGSVGAQETLSVEVPAVLDRDAPIAEAVQRECNVESTVGHAVYSAVKRRYRDAQIAGRASDGPELHLTILAVRGVGPGPWSGSKSIEVLAEVVHQRKTIDSNVFRREVGGSGFGRIRGACEVFARVATVIGREIAAWVPGVMAGISAAPAASRPAASPAPAASSTKERTASELQAVERLETLKQLFDSGKITREEYDRKRDEILKSL